MKFKWKILIALFTIVALFLLVPQLRHTVKNYVVEQLQLRFPQVFNNENDTIATSSLPSLTDGSITHDDNAVHGTIDYSNKTTDNNIHFDVQPADKRFIAEWINADNEQWHKVYFDDYDADGYFWGKEWNEAEDVHENDLLFHGNGWFRWKIDGKVLSELHCMDQNSLNVPKSYYFKYSNSNELYLIDAYFKDNKYRFFKKISNNDSVIVL